jgi:hypothetical protein
MKRDLPKLDQWQIVFDHAQSQGLYLHFKLQEQEIDDNRRGQGGAGARVDVALDGDLRRIEHIRAHQPSHGLAPLFVFRLRVRVGMLRAR